MISLKLNYLNVPNRKYYVLPTLINICGLLIILLIVLLLEYLH